MNFFKKLFLGKQDVIPEPVIITVEVEKECPDLSDENAVIRFVSKKYSHSGTFTSKEELIEFERKEDYRKFLKEYSYDEKLAKILTVDIERIKEYRRSEIKYANFGRSNVFSLKEYEPFFLKISEISNIVAHQHNHDINIYKSKLNYLKNIYTAMLEDTNKLIEDLNQFK